MMNRITLPTIGVDGFYHPSTEEEIVALVEQAVSEKLGIRCRGAAHSVSRAIYTDPGAGCPPLPNEVSEQLPPQGPNLNLMFDKYTQLTWIDAEKGIIEVEAGMHLGYDPEDPTGQSTLENNLLYTVFLKGWTLSDLGGITHQTVGGFLMTGSAGGTVQFNLEENLLAVRMIDGLGKVEWVEKESNPDLFYSSALSMGLLGIISKVRFQLTPNFFIYGQQLTTATTAADCPIDLFGDGSTSGKPSMQTFLQQTPYTRLLWWPQKKVERVVIWQAVRGAATPVFDPQPYFEFGTTPFSTNLEQIAAAILFTLLGNSSFGQTWRKLGSAFAEFKKNITRSWGGTFWAKLGAGIVTFLMKIIGFILVLLFSMFRGLLIWVYPTIIDILQPITKKGKAQLFMDYVWRSLPMDNEANDVMMGTEFTELWIPIGESQRAMNLLQTLFDQHGITATGYYSTELYAGSKSNFWLSPSYQQDVIRLDFFWYCNNEKQPADKGNYYSLFWEAFRKENIPFRLHWGKFLPEYEYEDWAAYFKSQYPRWDDFMALRTARDPHNIFLTN
jgi:D-arabinono-1,4-lactone oxidase